MKSWEVILKFFEEIQICGRGGDSSATISDVAKTEARTLRGKMTS